LLDKRFLGIFASRSSAQPAPRKLDSLLAKRSIMSMALANIAENTGCHISMRFTIRAIKEGGIEQKL
jgi:hypothetical protein